MGKAELGKGSLLLQARPGGLKGAKAESEVPAPAERGVPGVGGESHAKSEAKAEVGGRKVFHGL